MPGTHHTQNTQHTTHRTRTRLNLEGSEVLRVLVLLALGVRASALELALGVRASALELALGVRASVWVLDFIEVKTAHDFPQQML